MTQTVSLDAHPIVLEDNAPSGSIKSFTVPSGEEWEVLSVYAQFDSSATVGDRRIIVGMNTPGSTQLLMRSWAGVAHVPSERRFYSFAPGLPDQKAYVDGGDLMTPLARMVLSERQNIYIHDGLGIDPTGDELRVRITVLRRFVNNG